MKNKAIKPTPIKRVSPKSRATEPKLTIKATGKCIAAAVGCGNCPCGGPDCGHHLGLNPN